MEEEYWAPHPQRWHVQSLAVAEEFQRRGIGKRLMREVMVQAEAERVVVGLEASGMGEVLYRSLGFEEIGRVQKVWEARWWMTSCL